MISRTANGRNSARYNTARYNSARYDSAHPYGALARHDGAHPGQERLGQERVPLRKREPIRERDAVTHRVTGTDGVSAADLRRTGARCPEHLASPAASRARATQASRHPSRPVAR